MNLEQLGVQEINTKEKTSINGGDIPYAPFSNADPKDSVEYFNHVGQNLIAGVWNTGALITNLVWFS
ncbi:hypothetical protein [uncultured Algibacter sp.]|uniref:hypothetical protein n=1 Tax=uncultured Algibacter sp. TaxID=298659 RepID=UPI003217022E